jgi:hypothetical protein
VLGPTAVAILCAMCLFDAVADAQGNVETCAGVEVRSIGISAEFERKVLLDAMPARIDIVSLQPSTLKSTAAGKAITVIALGPVLGSMDSPDVKTNLGCTAKGFVLTATLTRSANYTGAAAKNVLWRPRISIAAVLRQPEGTVEATWRMRLTTGREINHARTPPYTEQEYPITVTKTIR